MTWGKNLDNWSNNVILSSGSFLIVSGIISIIFVSLLKFVKGGLGSGFKTSSTGEWGGVRNVSSKMLSITGSVNGDCSFSGSSLKIVFLIH